MKSVILFVFTSIIFGLRAAAQNPAELTDRKNIVFARNLLNWDKTHTDSLMFDIYYPTGATSDKKYPVYFSLHGGSFTTSTKQSESDFADQFADNGFIVIAPDYRVGYKNSHIPCSGDSVYLQEAVYRAMQDVNACIRYVTNHAGLFNVDTSLIFMGGASAGGTLTLNAAYVTDSFAAIYYPHSVNTLGTLQTSGNNEPYNYKIKGLCAMWGGMPYWDSLINSKSAIATIMFKGGKDGILPNGVGHYLFCPSNSVVRAGSGIYNVMNTLNVPCVYHFQPNGIHAAYDNEFCITNAVCFFNALMQAAPYNGYYMYYSQSCR